MTRKSEFSGQNRSDHFGRLTFEMLGKMRCWTGEKNVFGCEQTENNQAKRNYSQRFVN